MTRKKKQTKNPLFQSIILIIGIDDQGLSKVILLGRQTKGFKDYVIGQTAGLHNIIFNSRICQFISISLFFFTGKPLCDIFSHPLFQNFVYKYYGKIIQRRSDEIFFINHKLKTYCHSFFNHSKIYHHELRIGMYFLT